MKASLATGFRTPLKSFAPLLRTHPRSRFSEHGQALILFAAGLVAFLGLVGMSVDIGNVAYTKASLQNAADAAALAGSQNLDGTASAVAAAKASADDYLVKNGLSSATCRPNCATVNSAYDTVTVSLAKQVDYMFLKFVGLSHATPDATAAAKVYTKTVTGYDINQTAPFIIWGGTRATEVHPGDSDCPYHTCVGQSYTFLDTGWMGASGNPTAPDWTASGSNNFKGDVNHGEGADIVQVGDSRTVTSNGGLGSVTPPAVGSIIVLPIMNKASGGSSGRTFTIAAWVRVEVAAGCRKQHCEGTVLGPGTPPPGMTTSTTGSTPPPATLSQFITYGGLIQ